jgi:hypothetical protein
VLKKSLWLSLNKDNRSAEASQPPDATYVPVMVKDALAGKHGEYEMVLINPPFGKKSSITIVNEAGDKRNNHSSFIAMIFGQAQATNNSTFSSTFSPS